MKLPKKPAKVTDKEVNEVLASLAKRDAQRKDVDRAAKDGDQIWIDFEGVDAKTKEPINGGSGKDYPLLLGSNTFIPGFEANLVDVKANDEKTFTLSFPKDYGVKALQSRKVTFKVTVSKVQEVVEPKIDDAFAIKLGPFESLDGLKADIKKEMLEQKERQAEGAYVDELLGKITEASKVAIPDILITEQIDRLVAEQKQNLVYRGQTWQEFLDLQEMTEEAYRATLRADAELRVKAGLVLAAITDAEGIVLTEEELKARMQHLKAQYRDKQMRAQLATPEGRREVASRLVTEKTLDRLTEYATA